MTTLEQLRALGIRMGTWHADGRCVGWTTVAAKAEAAAKLSGVGVTHVQSSDDRFTGWEVRCQDG